MIQSKTVPNYLKQWEYNLKSTRESAVECLPIIMKEINNAESFSLKRGIAIKLIVFLTQNISNSNAFYDIYTNLFRELLPFIDDSYIEGIMQYFNYVLSVLVNKEQWTEALSLLPLISIKKTENLKTIRTYFDILVKPISLIIARDKYKENIKECYFKNITRILQISFDLNQDLFLQLSVEIFDTNNLLRQNITTHFNDATEFFKEFFVNLSQVKSIETFDVFYVKITKMLFVILNMELKHSDSPIITLDFLKSCLIVEKIETHKYCHQVLSLFYSFIRICNSKCRVDNFDESLKRILNKFMEVLDVEKKTDVLFSDTVVTLAEILVNLIFQIRGMINEENIILSFDLLIQLIKTLPNINYNKTFSCSCGNIKRHEIFNVAETANYLYRRAIELDLKEKSVGKSMLTIISYTSATFESFKCKNAELLLNHLYLGCFKSITSVESEFHAAYAIKMLDIFVKLKATSEKIPPIRLVYLYKKLYYHSNDYKSCVQMYSLYIAHLLSRQDSGDLTREILLCSKMYEAAGYDYRMSLCDILEQELMGFKIPTFDKKLLLRLHLEVALKHYPEEKYKVALAERVLEQTESENEFALIVNKLGVIVIQDLHQRVENSILKLQLQVKNSSIPNKNPELYLSLGYLYKRLFIFKFDKAKKTFVDKSFSESTLNSMDCSQFKNVRISVENDVIEAAVNSVNYLWKFFENKQSCTVEYTLFDIIDCVSYLGRHLKLRGYIDHAFKAWNLVYKAACETNCALNKIRALSFFSELADIISFIDTSIDINKLIETSAQEIINNFQEIDLLTPRLQNYVLTCILNIARYYASVSDFESASMLIRGVQQKLNEMESRKDSFELVAATLHAVNFYISVQCTRNLLISPYIYALNIMEAIKNIKYITSEDTVNIPMLLFDAVLDIAQFLMNRLCASGVKPYLYMMLKFAVDLGLTFRITQILCCLAHIDLQMEMNENCQTKLFIMNILLEDVQSEILTGKRQISPEAQVSCSISPVFLTTDMTVDPIRKAVPKNLSPKYINLSSLKTCLNRYLTSHKKSCTCILCKNPIFKMVYFQTGALTARYYYIMQDYKIAETFFKEAFVWWKNLDNIYLNIFFRDFLFWTLMYYINSLRRAKDYDVSLKICNLSFKYYEQYESIFDIAHFQNALEQKTSAEYIIKSVAVKPVQNYKDRICKEGELQVTKSAKKILRYRPLNVVQTGKIDNSTERSCELKLPEENNNEKGKRIIEEKTANIAILEEPENKIAKASRRGRKLQNCESSKNIIDTKEGDAVVLPTQPNIIDKNAARNEIGKMRNAGSYRIKSSLKSTTVDDNQGDVRLTRSRKKLI